MKTSVYYLLICFYFALIVATFYHTFEVIEPIKENINEYSKCRYSTAFCTKEYNKNLKEYPIQVYFVRPLFILAIALSTLFLIRNYPKHKGA